MDVVIASSRGKDMKDYMKSLHPNSKKLKIIVVPSLKLTKIRKELNYYLREIKPHQRATCHIYIVAGICDVTYKDCDRSYEEVIFNESREEAFTRISPIIQGLADDILEWGGIPCFATIVPMSLSTWNHTRLEQGKTASLIHHQQYESMQANMLRAIRQLNGLIMGLNNALFMFTPLLAGTITTNMPGNRPPRVHYNRLADGVHPTAWLRRVWVEKLIQAMRTNRERRHQQDHDDTLDEIRDELNRSLENFFANVN